MDVQFPVDEEVFMDRYSLFFRVYMEPTRSFLKMLTATVLILKRDDSGQLLTELSEQTTVQTSAFHIKYLVLVFCSSCNDIKSLTLFTSIHIKITIHPSFNYLITFPAL